MGSAAYLVPSQPARGRNSRFSGPVSALRVTIACAGARLSSLAPTRPWEGRRGAAAGPRETPGIEQGPVVNRAGSCRPRPDLPTRRLAFLRSVMGASSSPPCKARRPRSAAGWKALAGDDAAVIPARARGSWQRRVAAPGRGFGQAERPCPCWATREGRAAVMGTAGSPAQGRPLHGAKGFPRPSSALRAPCRAGDPPPLRPYGQPCAGPPPALAGRQGFRRGAASRSSPATPPD